MTYCIFNIGKMMEKDADIILWGSSITLETSCNQKISYSNFDRSGMLRTTHQEGDLFPIGSGDGVIVNPVLVIEVDDLHKIVRYDLEGEGVPSMPMLQGDILRIIYQEYEQAAQFYEKLKASDTHANHMAYKRKAVEMLENIINFDKYSFIDFGFERPQ